MGDVSVFRVQPDTVIVRTADEGALPDDAFTRGAARWAREVATTTMGVTGLLIDARVRAARASGASHAIGVRPRAPAFLGLAGLATVDGALFIEFAGDEAARLALAAMADLIGATVCAL